MLVTVVVKAKSIDFIDVVKVVRVFSISLKINVREKGQYTRARARTCAIC